MSYDLSELIGLFRRDMDDTVEPYLWSDDDITDYLDDAQEEFCHEVDVIADQVTLAYTASTDFVALPEYVTRIRDGDRPSGRRLDLYNHEEFRDAILSDDYGMLTPNVGWETDVGPEPKALITDIKSDSVRLYPLPTADGSITLRVFRLPIKKIADEEDPEVTDKQHQRCMILYARHLGYLKHDAETYNPKLSAEMEEKFYDRLLTFQQREKRRRRRARTTSYGGY